MIVLFCLPYDCNDCLWHLNKKPIIWNFCIHFVGSLNFAPPQQTRIVMNEFNTWFCGNLEFNTFLLVFDLYIVPNIKNVFSW